MCTKRLSVGEASEGGGNKVHVKTPCISLEMTGTNRDNLALCFITITTHLSNVPYAYCCDVANGLFFVLLTTSVFG